VKILASAFQSAIQVGMGQF